jgi:hypothetical protein
MRRIPIARGNAEGLWLAISLGLIALAVWSSFR